MDRELKKGMYVKTRDGEIHECNDVIIDKNNPKMNRFSNEFGNIKFFNEIIKESNDITDLIEIGDVLLVDGIKYTVLQNKEHCNNILHIKTINNKYSTISYLFEQNMVEAIVTKEQFEAMRYVVER